ncbi:MAG: triphosphoribosyl-dephospho-CoA synthase [Vicinamibacterales bacterium]
MRADVNILGSRGSVVGQIVASAQMACLLEAAAPKPGNVSPGRPFRDVTYEDFVASAVAIGEPFRLAAERPLGETIRAAIDATRQWTPVNTNLGIVLLLAPLVKAACLPAVAREGVAALRSAVTDVLASTSVRDARDVYAAIRAARPGGLGTVPTEDVQNEPTLDLQSVMRLAAHRDTIAREYVTSFDLTFSVGAPTVARAVKAGLDWNDVVVETFLHLMATTPDTHIARRAGEDAAAGVSRTARMVLDTGGVRTEAGRHALDALDQALRDPLNTLNPGTTADLTAAAIFVALLGGTAVHRAGPTIVRRACPTIVRRACPTIVRRAGPTDPPDEHA